MYKILISILLFSNIFVLSQNRLSIYDPIREDTIFYYLENDKIFKCFAKKNIGKTDKCEIREEILPNTQEYKTWFRFLKCRETKSPLYYKNYAYELPYRTGKYHKVIQGYNGDFSHYGKNAIDFEMPIGSEVLASRGGIVVKIVKNYNQGCSSQECAKYGNYISILHEDGTRAEYYHLKHNGATVKVGEKVEKGYLIGYSGNTGWSSVPHLHFVCYSPPCFGMLGETIKTLFRTGDGKRVEYLQEGKSYLKNY
ncbi:M23 family metallopeptidase [Chryseobacterium daeguense]|uniref:M23 family metallopeptidase n=1 Tax=Chryseobacterium daeguense TaxID=412438 RepID=UPI00041FFE1B|nr:M23 family metallopeptidase [Chryseobacterium daeguense]